MKYFTIDSENSEVYAKLTRKFELQKVDLSLFYYFPILVCCAQKILRRKLGEVERRKDGKGSAKGSRCCE